MVEPLIPMIISLIEYRYTHSLAHKKARLSLAFVYQ